MADVEIIIKIPEEQIKKSLEESKNIHEDEGEKGSVNILMLYTNGHLDFVDVVRKTDFYSCEYEILPKGHGRIIDEDQIPGDGGWDWSDRLDLTPAIIEAEESNNE